MEKHPLGTRLVGCLLVVGNMICVFVQIITVIILGGK